MLFKTIEHPVILQHFLIFFINFLHTDNKESDQTEQNTRAQLFNASLA